MEEVILAKRPDSSFAGVAQCLWIGNVTREVVQDEGIEEEDVSVEDVERSCACMREKVMVFFLCGRHNLGILSHM